MKLDILVMAAHPDDAELSCSGTILKHIKAGKKVGIVDFTQGELGSRGSAAIRLEEAAESTKILGIHVRENMGFSDGFFQNDKDHQMALINIIRKYQPKIVLANALDDRHPDHGKGADLSRSACFLSGLKKIETTLNGEKQTAWRPTNVFHYIQDRYMKPDFVVDISDLWEQKVASIKAYKSQFFDPDAKEPQTYISTPEFLKFIEARAREMGHAIGVTYGEGFISEKQIGVNDLFNIY